jgi:serine/threonine-protein kinase
MSAMAKVGDQIGQYLLTALIAPGGMSTVFRAHDERLDRDVALKLLSAELSEDPGFRDRFQRESRVAAGIRHPNILPVFDAGDWQGQLYIAMQLVEGPDLALIIERGGPIPPARTASIISQVAAALDAAHALGIVHRDVKPGNILLVPGSGPATLEHVYLSDFGLNRRITSTTQMTHSGVT